MYMCTYVRKFQSTGKDKAVLRVSSDSDNDDDDDSSPSLEEAQPLNTDKTGLKRPVPAMSESTSTKRKLSEKIEDQLENPIDQEIEKKKTGNTPIEIKITNCQEPTYERLLRKLDGRFLRALKERMKADPIAPGIPPLALHCISVSTKSDFLPHLVNQYKFEVLGGLHSITAKKELLEEMPGHSIYSNCLAFVYCGLTDEECLRLSARHNVNGHFNHKMQHKDYVEACRARLFVMEGKDCEDETPSPSLTWKNACKSCILPQGIGNTWTGNIFAQAALPRETYRLAIKVMDAYTRGETKGQKPPTNSLQLKKPLEFKQYYLEPLQHLDEDFQVATLENVLAGKWSISEMQAMAKKERSLKSVKEMYLRYEYTYVHIRICMYVYHRYHKLHVHTYGC
jgi:hypothetical protein